MLKFPELDHESFLLENPTFSRREKPGESSLKIPDPSDQFLLASLVLLSTLVLCKPYIRLDSQIKQTWTFRTHISHRFYSIARPTTNDRTTSEHGKLGGPDLDLFFFCDPNMPDTWTEYDVMKNRWSPATYNIYIYPIYIPYISHIYPIYIYTYIYMENNYGKSQFWAGESSCTGSQGFWWISSQAWLWPIKDVSIDRGLHQALSINCTSGSAGHDLVTI
jgi:hypothetical protein